MQAKDGRLCRPVYTRDQIIEMALDGHAFDCEGMADEYQLHLGARKAWLAPDQWQTESRWNNNRLDNVASVIYTALREGHLDVARVIGRVGDLRHDNDAAARRHSLTALDRSFIRDQAIEITLLDRIVSAHEGGER